MLVLIILTFYNIIIILSSFWIQICGPQNSELDFLVDGMTEYYNQKENQQLHAIREPYLGQIVAALLLTDNKWYVVINMCSLR